MPRYSARRMRRDAKSERSQRVVLDAALKLFSRRGYRATTVREIAEAAHVSTGNLYHHFPDKEAIFRTLLDEYREIVMSPRFGVARALSSGTFPDNLEDFGYAIRDVVRQFRSYMALHYVDVIEFDGTHIREFYSSIDKRFTELVEGKNNGGIAIRVRPGISAISALHVATRTFLQYFQLETLFGVPEPFGKDSADVVREIADILRNGIAERNGTA